MSLSKVPDALYPLSSRISELEKVVETLSTGLLSTEARARAQSAGLADSNLVTLHEQQQRLHSVEARLTARIDELQGMYSPEAVMPTNPQSYSPLFSVHASP